MKIVGGFVVRGYLVLAVFVVLVSCSARQSENDALTTSEPNEPTTTVQTVPTTTTTVRFDTTTTIQSVSPDLLAVVESAIVEWNSGETPRWRATFADEALTRIGGDDYPIGILQDEYEFFSVLGQIFSLIRCFPADGDSGEAVLCDMNSSDGFADGLGVSPVESVGYFDVVNGQIVNYRASFTGANSIRTAWLEFAVWVGDQDSGDGEAMTGFPGDAEGALVALEYMDGYFQTN